MSPIRPFCLLFVVAGLLLAHPAMAVVTTLPPGSTIDFNTDSTADLLGYSCCSGQTALRAINGTLRASSGQSWENVTLANAQTLNFVTDPSNGGVLPMAGYDVLIYKTPDNNFYKLRAVGSNTSAGIEIEYEFIGSASTPPPVASFTFSTFDIVASFTDTSTNTPSSWMWDFGDGDTSTFRNPQHAYAAAGTYTVCLVATNVGGSSPPDCQSVTVTELPSTSVSPGNGIDFDNDSLIDLRVENVAGCGSTPNRLNPQNGATWGSLSQNYTTVTLTDAQGTGTSTSPFCHPVGSFTDTLIVNSSNGFFYKAWTPTNTASGVRFVFELLGTPPSPPTAGFTFSTFDLIASFTDQSSGTVTSRNWDFGDGDSSSGTNPSHVYASAGTYTVCLVASNAGGDSAPSCQSVTVAEVPSTTVNSGQTIDFDGDMLGDLLVELNSCGGVNRFVVQNGTEWSGSGGFYPDVDLADAQSASYGTSPFCHPVADPNATLLMITSDLRYVKAWTPENDASGVRFQFEILGTVTDNMPDPFGFTQQNNVPLNALITSDTVTITGINSAAVVTISNGEYSLNGAAFTNAQGMAVANDQLTVRHTSSNLFSTMVTTTLTVGGVAGTFNTVTEAADSEPNQFLFTDQTDVPLDALIESDLIIVGGINTSAPIAVVNGEFSINNGPYTSAAGQTVVSGNSVRVRHQSAATFSTTIETTLTIGGISDVFSSTTLPPDTTPEPFGFMAQSNLPFNTVVESNSITITGIDSPAPISISGGEYSINNGPYTSFGSGATINDGDTVRVRQTSAGTLNTTTDAVLDIGGVMGAFSVTTMVDFNADLSISVSDDVDPAVAGNEFTYTITVANDGPAEAPNALVSVNLPLNTTLASTSGCTEDPLGAPDCHLGAIAIGGMASYTLTVAVDSDSAGVPMLLTATASSDVDDLVSANNSASEPTSSIAQADLALTKVSNSYWTAAGGTIDYEITIDNLGPSDVPGALVVDVPPPRLGNVTWTCDAAPGSSCPASGLNQINTSVDVAAGSSVLFTLTGQLLDQDEAPLTNTAAVTAPTGVTELGSGNNQDSDTDLVGLFADGMESVEPD
ncbi:MAG: hypothetical protein Tsb002_21410 [Wenzhouxiangellaceae bacterium]